MKKKICYCKKSYLYDQIGSEEIFTEGKYYKYYVEEDDIFFWVIYNKHGDSGHQGCRFHINKKDYTKTGKVDAFYEFFEEGRKMKLRKLKLMENGR